jgi:hypothetical protein
MRYCAVLCLAGLLLVSPTREAAAQTPAPCGFVFWGEVYDEFDNVVWSSPDYDPEEVNLGTPQNVGACISDATGIADWFSYHVCLARSAGVEVAYQGEVYFGVDVDGPIYITTLYFPDSCRDDWGLNYYNTMAANDSLAADDYLESPSMDYSLVYQQDGNLVLYHGSSPLWSIGNTDGNPGYAVMQSDGNLVVYNGSSSPVWASNTDGNPGAFLAIRDTGELVIYGTDGTVLWYVS